MSTAYKVQHWNALSAGGAYIGALGVHRALREAGVESRMYTHRGHRPTDAGVQHWRVTARGRGGALRSAVRKAMLAGFNPRVLLRRVGEPANPLLPKFYFADSFLGAPTPVPAELRGEETVHNLHWITGMLDYPSFFPSLPARQPVIWTLHDWAPFTGGCHYPAGCRHFHQQCGNCHYQPRPAPDDASARNFQIKLAALRSLENLHIVGNSEDTMRHAQASPLFAHARSFQTIYCSLDLQVFQPRSRETCRELLGLPQNAVIICFGALDVDELRKGGDLLRAGLQQLAATLRGTGREILLISFGRGRPGEGPGAGELRQRHFGLINEPGFLALLYNAADMFIMPSREEAFGQVAMEAMSCGIPAIGFRVGGVPELILHRETGLLVPPEDVAQLAESMRELVEDGALRQQLGAAAHQMVARRFGRPAQAAAYQTIYEEALEYRRAADRT